MYVDIQEVIKHPVPSFSIAPGQNPVAFIWEVEVAVRGVAVIVGNGRGHRMQSMPELLSLTNGDSIVLIPVNHQHRDGDVAGM